MQVPFETLEEQYKPLIFHVMKTLHIYRDKDFFYQVGLIGLWEAAARFDEGRSVEFSTFAYTTIRGMLLDQLRNESRHADICIAGSEDVLYYIEDPSPGKPFEHDLIDLYCSDLTVNQLRWVQGRIIEDKSYKEIANEHGVTVEAVKSWGKTAARRLRETLGDANL